MSFSASGWETQMNERTSDKMSATQSKETTPHLGLSQDAVFTKQHTGQSDSREGAPTRTEEAVDTTTKDDSREQAQTDMRIGDDTNASVEKTSEKECNCDIAEISVRAEIANETENSIDTTEENEGNRTSKTKPEKNDLISASIEKLKSEVETLESDKARQNLGDKEWENLIRQTENVIKTARIAIENAKLSKRQSHKVIASRALLLEWEHKIAISDSIRARMKELGMNQNELSFATGIGIGQISLIINGKQNMTLRTMARIEAALDFRLDSGFKYHV
ncbi:Helix-turn-helix [Parafannyhessea umbonata]|uniref:Helix-turn-helix n=2 Tax=Parafannyhessea umbonata TaxID=604330 RepID=A0A1H9NKL5_9ACTN|nr:Helix-turn-helix [Parafannyhessea umbonata]